METITIHHRGDPTPTEHVLYDEDEARDAGIEYVGWHDADEGQWALTDDGVVAEVLKKRVYPGKKAGEQNHYFRFAFGYTFFNPKYPTTTLNARGRQTPHTHSGKPQLEVRAGQTPLQNLAMAYALVFQPDLALDMVFQGGLDPAEHRKYKRYMKSETFKTMVRDELKKLTDDAGFSDTETMELLQIAKGIAIAEGKSADLVRIFEKIADLKGWNDKDKVKLTNQLEAVSTQRLVDDIREEEHRLKATRVQELPDETTTNVDSQRAEDADGTADE